VAPALSHSLSCSSNNVERGPPTSQNIGMDSELDITSTSQSNLTRQELTRLFRRRVGTHLVDDSLMATGGTALYSLSDPRDIRQIRYIGITQNPRRRLLQHWSTARLWLPDQKPWWVSSPKLRPLYDWIRDLYRDEQRLPAMIVSTWLGDPKLARCAERSLIYECLARRLQLLNVEREILHHQVPLL
jgi:hypothetical protein